MAFPCREVHGSITRTDEGVIVPQCQGQPRPWITPFFVLPLPTADLSVHTLLLNHCVNSPGNMPSQLPST